MENICEWKNCKKSGTYKAPLEKDNSKNINGYVKNTLNYSIKVGIILKACLKMR